MICQIKGLDITKFFFRVLLVSSVYQHAAVTAANIFEKDDAQGLLDTKFDPKGADINTYIFLIHKDYRSDKAKIKEIEEQLTSNALDSEYTNKPPGESFGTPFLVCNTTMESAKKFKEDNSKYISHFQDYAELAKRLSVTVPYGVPQPIGERAGKLKKRETELRQTDLPELRMLSQPPNETTQSSHYWQDSKEGEGVVIYILDSGYDENHPEFKNARERKQILPLLRAGPNHHRSTVMDGDQITYHGTAALGKIIGETTGVARKAKISMVSVVDDNGQVSMLTFINGLYIIYEEIKKGDPKAKSIIIISGLPSGLYPTNKEMTEPVKAIWEVVESVLKKIGELENTLTVISAKDKGPDAENNSFIKNVAASSKRFLIAGSVTETGEALKQETDVEIAALGDNVAVPFRSGAGEKDLYRKAHGSDVAAATVAGNTANIWAENIEFSAEEIKAKAIDLAYPRIPDGPMVAWNGKYPKESASPTHCRLPGQTNSADMKLPECASTLGVSTFSTVTTKGGKSNNKGTRTSTADFYDMATVTSGGFNAEITGDGMWEWPDLPEGDTWPDEGLGFGSDFFGDEDMYEDDAYGGSSSEAYDSGYDSDLDYLSDDPGSPSPSGYYAGAPNGEPEPQYFDSALGNGDIFAGGHGDGSEYSLLPTEVDLGYDSTKTEKILVVETPLPDPPASTAGAAYAYGALHTPAGNEYDYLQDSPQYYDTDAGNFWRRDAHHPIPTATATSTVMAPTKVASKATLTSFTKGTPMQTQSQS
ncbi:hypothetical protein ABW19_dt0206164 [Dactylella cylindrospora]|nr:hypothetical protein ABW19_dt0206164 [Dactylella cylindrospora]